MQSELKMVLVSRDTLSTLAYGPYATSSLSIVQELRAILAAPADPPLQRAWQAGYDTGFYNAKPAHEREFVVHEAPAKQTPVPDHVEDVRPMVEQTPSANGEPNLLRDFEDIMVERGYAASRVEIESDRVEVEGLHGYRWHGQSYFLWCSGRRPLLAEIQRLKHFEAAYKEWSDKTDWVQKSGEVRDLGKHRADVLKDRFDKRSTRIAELEAQQGEPVAWALDVEGYRAVIIDDHQRALYEQQHFRDRGRTATVYALYRGSQPDTAVLAEPHNV